MSSKPELDGGETLPLESSAVTVPPAGDLPFADWDRYEMLELLGKGGMGVVYKARDRRLDRVIAIKLLRGADPSLMMRFLREARAQARIDHPHICRVYEVGAVEGRVYIALQLVDGEPLHEAAAHMALAEKIRVMRDVAAAIHEAHRLDIVHRDIKPSNIMIERTEDGRGFPIVMDFGLARELTVEPGITESGALLGTPSYMSPEQARGDIHAIDRRTDVYSLGATLYELLTGQSPFPGMSLADTLARVIHDEPVAPRSLVPGLPVDLEIIALKCLAKDPAQRYPSARALADDLGRFLDGEPILGRRLSLWKRVRLRAGRHRALVILGACSLAAILAVGALGVRRCIVARERARLAARLGEEATEIEGFLREAYQWPLHDTRPDRQRMRERMKAIAATQHDLGELGDAIVHDALGRGHLALHEWREAADELGRAEAAGRRSPELHAARGRALGELYRLALEEARRSEDKEWVARRQQELARQYLTPALAEIESSRASGADTELLDALLALYQRDFAVAEQKALAVARRSPGLADARKLAADAVYGAALEASDRGDYMVASLGLERATALYAEASEIGRSDASIYEASAQAWLQRAEVDYRQKRSPLASLERALEVIENRALRADPDDARAYTLKSYVLLSWYRRASPTDRGDKRPLLDRVALAAARAVEIDPRDAHAWTALGNAHITRGSYEQHYGGGQGGPWFDRALEELGTALTIQPGDVRANSSSGIAHRWRGVVLDQHGRDPIPEYRAALHSYERAAATDPKDLPACANQIDLHVSIAEYDEAIGIDPGAAITSAQRVGERCLAINANHNLVLDFLVQAQLALALHLVEADGDPMAALEKARGYLHGIERVQPESMLIWYRRLTVAVLEAMFHLRRGEAPTESITAGRAALREALRLKPGSAHSYVQAARLDLVEAAWEAARAPGGAAAMSTSALRNAEQALAIDGQLASARLVAAEACLRLAATQPSRALIDLGLAHVEQALTRNPRLRKARPLRDQLAELSRRHAP